MNKSITKFISTIYIKKNNLCCLLVLKKSRILSLIEQYDMYTTVNGDIRAVYAPYFIINQAVRPVSVPYLTVYDEVTAKNKDSRNHRPGLNITFQVRINNIDWCRWNGMVDGLLMRTFFTSNCERKEKRNNHRFFVLRPTVACENMYSLAHFDR